MTSFCWLCSAGSIERPEIDGRDNTLKPCSICLGVIAQCVEELEMRDKKKKRKGDRTVYEGPDGEFYCDEFDEDDLDVLDEEELQTEISSRELHGGMSLVYDDEGNI